MERFLTTAEAGRLLGLTAASVRRLEQGGELPIAASTEGGIRLFRRADVAALVNRRAAARRGGRSR